MGKYCCEGNGLQILRALELNCRDIYSFWVESQRETIGDNKELQQIVLGGRISRLGELLYLSIWNCIILRCMMYVWVPISVLIFHWSSFWKFSAWRQGWLRQATRTLVFLFNDSIWILWCLDNEQGSCAWFECINLWNRFVCNLCAWLTRTRFGGLVFLTGAGKI